MGRFRNRVASLVIAGLALVGVASVAPAAAPLPERPASPAPARSLKLVNGRWFDGRTFRRRVFYAAGGVLTGTAPAAVEETVDLKDGYVVPPFGDAHNHYIAGPHDIDAILGQYLRDGIFYAKSPARRARN